MHPESRLLSLSLSLSLTHTPLSIYREVYVDVFLFKTVGLSSASHRHNDIISTKLSTCRRLLVVPPRQLLPSARSEIRQKVYSVSGLTKIRQEKFSRADCRMRPDRYCDLCPLSARRVPSRSLGKPRSTSPSHRCLGQVGAVLFVL